MFDKVGQAAERFATGISRRAFFGWLGRGALSGIALFTGASAVFAAPPRPCILNGGCCPTGMYWAPQGQPGIDYKGCYYDSKCHKPLLAGCINSDRCCGGSGSCFSVAGLCYADTACNTPC
jgi:hypothetical protein